ncbi:MAG TPA: tRNA (adenosine(37)-N6)-dimethylallyltransferase MiaA, partial [Rickettsiales bacterium]|nr:tRNA (adenosine(37)-N6)-dimethylallyltransferase MiaA [Rickettsiales bacterium]
MTKVVIISGATASGKSALAFDFAACRDVAIINADALQIFQGLPILSAQPSLQEKLQVPHFLYSHLKFNESVSVGLWLDLVSDIIQKVLAQNKVPLIVGGSGMYISKLFDGISQVPEISASVKKEVRELYQELGRQDFIKKLREIGENSEIENLDKQRLIRLYEVLKETKKTLKFWQESSKKFIFDPKIFIHINLEIERKKLYENCNLRFEKMLENGAVEEV